MTDQEVICSFMERKPDAATTFWHPGKTSPQLWWECVYGPVVDGIAGDPHWHPRKITLNECHAVQERLTDAQWERYGDAVRESFRYQWPDPHGIAERRFFLHATAEQKIRALASVLRESEVA